MDENGLPTEEDLRKLYEEKGHEALAWYAWRNALRALPLLGQKPLNQIWADKIVHYTYSLISALIFIQQSQLKSPDSHNVFKIKSRIALKAVDLFHVTASAIAELVSNNLSPHTVALAIDDIRSASKRAYVSDIKLANIVNTCTYSDAIVYAACKDFDYLKSLVAFAWVDLPIWLTIKPIKYNFWESRFLEELRFYKLDFLADDLQKLWSNQSLNNNAKNYLNDLSEVITNNPRALRRAILFGELTEQAQAVRVLLLGSGGAGKTSLANRLKGNNQNTQTPATIGIDYQQHQSLKLHETLLELKLASNDLDLYLWDFGGQTIFHGLHRAFLHENCVYILIVDNRHEQAPEEWLHQIRHLAGIQAKVLLVTNEYENCYSRQNEVRLIREFEGLLDKDSFFYFPCKKPDDESKTQAQAFEYFVKSLIKECEDSRKSVFASTLAVQRQLEQKYENEVLLHENYVLDLIEKETKETESALNQLKQLGFLISLKSGSLQYCLKPAWAVDNTYQVLYAESIRTNSGVASIREITKVLSEKIKVEHTEYLTDFLEERSLCCVLPNKQFFFPDAAAANEPELVRELLNDLINVTLRFDLPYLPLGFHTRLVHQLFNTHTTSIKDIKHVWRQGFILSTHEAQAIVQYHLRKASIEVVLVGKVEQFADLFQTFYHALKPAVLSEKGLKENQINLSLLFNEKPFSVNSSTDFLIALKSVHTFKDFAEEMNKLNQSTYINIIGDNNQTMTGSNSTQKQGSDNYTQH